MRPCHAVRLALREDIAYRFAHEANEERLAARAGVEYYAISLWGGRCRLRGEGQQEASQHRNRGCVDELLVENVDHLRDVE